MPSNHILINNSIEYCISDSEMDELIEWLGVNGCIVDTGIKKELDEVISVDKYSPVPSYKH